jgi:hypothetical protein
MAKKCKIKSIDEMSKELDSSARAEAEEYRTRNGLD